MFVKATKRLSYIDQLVWEIRGFNGSQNGDYGCVFGFSIVWIQG
jgi:hypothetical protein